jgi:O-antigen/teichoic acid export membrane protein
VTAALGAAQAFFAFGGARTGSYFEGRVRASTLSAWLAVAAAAPSLVAGLALCVAPLRTRLFPTLSPGLLALGMAPLPFLLLADSLVGVLLARRRERAYGPLVWARSAATGAVLATSLAVPDRLVWILGGRIAIAAAVAGALLLLLSDRPSVRGVPAFAPQAARFAIPAAASGALSTLHRRADVFLLSALGHTPEIGGYAIAYGLAEAFWIVTDSLETSLFVDLARLDADAARKKAGGAAAAYAVIGALAVAGLVVGRALLERVFGRDYPGAAGLFTWVLFAAIVWGVSRPFASYLYSRRRGSRVALANAAGLLVNVGLCLAWIPSAGALGAARATLASYALQLAALALLARGKRSPVGAAS